MPFVKISALPGTSQNVDKVMETMENNLYQKEILPRGSATFLWQTLDCMTHTRGDTGEVAKIMQSITSTLSTTAKIDRKYVFIHTHTCQSGHVYLLDSVWPCEMKHAGT